MKMGIILETERLILRTWTAADAEPYFQINQDPKVTEFLLGPLTREQVNEFITRMNQQQVRYGYTLWAVELKSTGELIGFVGLNYTDWPAPFTPAVEVGWRLGSQYWGKGYATEAAKAALAYGFTHCGLKEIVSFTVPANQRSIRVMEKIGLNHEVQGDFAHPKIPTTHPFSKHVLYRRSNPSGIQRFIFTGAPGCGKTSVLAALEESGQVVIHEAATAIIAEEQTKGILRPWEQPDFVDKIVLVQKARQLAAEGELQFYDRSPFCTYALARYLSTCNNRVFKPSHSLQSEINRCLKEGVYQNHVFFFENLGFVEPTEARKISFEESLVFERIHREVYDEFGFHQVLVPKLSVLKRAEWIKHFMGI